MSVRLLFLLPLIPLLALLHALPYLPRRGRLFGVAVPSEVRYGAQGAGLVRRFQLDLLPWSVVALLIQLAIPAPWIAWAVVAAPLVPLVAAARFFFVGRREAERFAAPPSEVREAALTDAGDRLGRRLLWFVPPFGVLSATAIYLHDHWSLIPARFAIHFDLNGHPNGWSSRTAGGVYGPLSLGAMIVLFILLIAEMTQHGSRRGTMRSTAFAVATGVAYLIAVVFSIAALSPFWVPPIWAMLGLIGGSMIAIGVLVAHAYSRPEPDGEPGEATPEGCWHAGEFYYNPDDPALFVEKRLGIGYTFNFANRLSWVLLGGIVAFVAGMIFLAPKLIGGK